MVWMQVTTVEAVVLKALVILRACYSVTVCNTTDHMLCYMLLIWQCCCRLQLVRRIGTIGSAVAVHWHSRLNQIFVGTGNMYVHADVRLVDSRVCQETVATLLASAVECSSINNLQCTW